MRIVDSIFDLNIRKFKEFNKHYMIYREVGGDFTSYDLHHIKLNRLINSDMKHEALIELQNMRQNVFNSLNEYLPEIEALKCVVHYEDHKKIEDISINEAREIIEEVKKKSLAK